MEESGLVRYFSKIALPTASAFFAASTPPITNPPVILQQQHSTTYSTLLITVRFSPESIESSDRDFIESTGRFAFRTFNFDTIAVCGMVGCR
jgi:hypothetical protein